MAYKKEYTPPVFIGQNIYLKPNYIVSIPEFYREGGDQRSLEFIQNQDNLLNNDQNGKLSRKAIGNLRNAINWLCLASKRKRVYVRSKGTEFSFKVNFVTLTLPDTASRISSKDLQSKLLNPFLTYLRKYHSLRNYVWRLEFQANGKLHVHLSADTFLHYQVVRDTWNRLLDKNGYLQQFFEKERHKDPNSTDVHATRKIKNMAAYISKYMSKQGAVYEYPLKSIKKKIDSAILAGVSEKGISALIAQKKKFENSPARKLGVMDWKRWYKQRVNFWNSPFNPHPITGRIWGCSTELSKANKASVHIPANECEQDLRCLMRPDIEYKEITVQPKTIESLYAQTQLQQTPRKIGEIYFLKALDWFEKINGKIRREFEQVRSNIATLNQTMTFELT